MWALKLRPPPFMLCCLIGGNGCHFLIQALQQRWWNSHLNSNGGQRQRPTAVFSFQTSTLKIYSAADKQDAAALGVLKELETDECFLCCAARASQETVWAASQATDQPLADGRQHLCMIPISSGYLSITAFQQKWGSFLPLRPRTSTSRSVWGQASSPDAGGLYLHHSCSRVAAESESRHRLTSALMTSQTKTMKYMIKKPVFIIDPQRKPLWKETAECQKQLRSPETHPTMWRKQIGWDLPLRINKPFSLELQIRRKGERQWPAWVYRVRI